MSRLFDGTADEITYALPASGAGPVNYAFGTLLVVARFVSAATWASLIEIEHSGGVDEKGALGRHSTGGIYATDGATLVKSDDGGTGTPFTVGTGDNWVLMVETKATGTVSPTFHKVPLATGTRTTHSPTGTQINTASIGSGTIRLGGNDDFANIRLAAAAILPSVVLSGADVDSIAAAKTTQSIIDFADANGWVVDDSDAFATNLVDNNTNRTSDTGTADDADDPSGWVYGLGGASGPSQRFMWLP